MRCGIKRKIFYRKGSKFSKIPPATLLLPFLLFIIFSIFINLIKARFGCLAYRIQLLKVDFNNWNLFKHVNNIKIYLLKINTILF